MQNEKRDLQLLRKYSPCSVNYFDRAIRSAEQVVVLGRNPCPRLKLCNKHPINCALYMGAKVAKEVMKDGTDLKFEMEGFIFEALEMEYYHLFVNSLDRKRFEQQRGKGRLIRAVEGFARIVLLENPLLSFYPTCPECEANDHEYNGNGLLLEDEVSRIVGTPPRLVTRKELRCIDCSYREVKK